MLNGDFTVKISDDVPFAEKVNCYANEELTYYIYSRGHMMRHICNNSPAKIRAAAEREKLPLLANKVLKQSLKSLKEEEELDKRIKKHKLESVKSLRKFKYVKPRVDASLDVNKLRKILLSHKSSNFATSEHPLLHERSSMLFSNIDRNRDSSAEYLIPKRGSAVRSSLEPISGKPLLSKVESVQQLNTSVDYADYPRPRQHK